MAIPFLGMPDSLRLFVLLLSFVLLVARFLGAGVLEVMLLDLPMVLVHGFCSTDLEEDLLGIVELEPTVGHVQ